MSWIAGELGALRDAGLLRGAPQHRSSPPGPRVVVDDRELVHLCSNDYLGLAGDKRVLDAAAEAVLRYGAGAGASRLVAGGSGPHRALEEALATWKACDDAILFSSGYLANAGTIPVLAGEGDAIFSDALNHASVVDGCRLSRATVRVYRHADASHLAHLLASTPARRRLVVTDSVFSMDGDVAPLAEVAALCDRYDATLMVDEAHASGLLGPRGAGGLDAAGVRAGAVMGTLSKALGSAGGFVCGSRELVALLRNRARTFVFDTAPPPAQAAAALAALAIAQAEPERRARALALARRLHDGLRAAGWDAREPAAAIVPVRVGDPAAAVALAERLRERGVLAPAIRPPSVPAGTSRIRVTAMATHADEDVERAIAAFGVPQP